MLKKVSGRRILRVVDIFEQHSDIHLKIHSFNYSINHSINHSNVDKKDLKNLVMGLWSYDSRPNLKSRV